MKVILLGCGYLGYNLYNLLKEQFQTEIWGIKSPYTPLLDSFVEVNAFDPMEMSRMNVEDAIVIDAIGLVANNAMSENEDEVLNSLCNRYQELLNSLKAGGAKCFIFFSSGGTVYGPSLHPIAECEELHPATLYAKSKTRIESIIQESEVPYLILRVANPYGGYQDPDKRQGVIPILIRKALLQEPFQKWVDDESTRDYIYMEDFAEAIHRLIEKSVVNEIVNVGSGVGISIKQVIESVETATGKTIQIEHCASDVPVVESIVLDVSKLQRLTGYLPETNLHAGIRKETERIRKELETL